MFEDKDITQEDIYNECNPPINDNKLIAEYMRLVVSDSENYDSQIHTNVDVDLKYYDSWDWLKPVVDEIEMRCEGVPQELIHLSLFSTRHEVYHAVVEFINNQNK